MSPLKFYCKTKKSLCAQLTSNVEQIIPTKSETLCNTKCTNLHQNQAPYAQICNMELTLCTKNKCFRKLYAQHSYTKIETHIICTESETWNKPCAPNQNPYATPYEPICTKKLNRTRKYTKIEAQAAYAQHTMHQRKLTKPHQTSHTMHEKAHQTTSSTTHVRNTQMHKSRNLAKPKNSPKQ